MNFSRLVSTVPLIRTIRPTSWMFQSRNMSSTVLNQSLYNLTEEEQMLKETVARYGKEHVEPYLREMEEKEQF
ncbi:unnamed protein product, partial [Adineta steineri]